MSADLFAEFGYGASANQHSRTEHQQTAKPQSNSLIPGLDAFEDAPPSDTSSHLSQHNPLSTQQQQHQRAVHDQFAQFNDFGDSGDFEQAQYNNGNDVLFDATLERFSNEEDDDDDWGEFESAESPANQASLKAPVQKPNIVEQSSKKPYTGAPRCLSLIDSPDSVSVQDSPTLVKTNHTRTLIKDLPKSGSDSLPSARPKIPVQDEPFEEWGDFIDGPPVEPSQVHVSKTTNIDNDFINKGVSLQTMDITTDPPSAHVRPTNIPPPSILLELFPQLFERLRREGAEAKKNAQHQQSLEAIALSIICTLKAVARVVAGRTMRWKRDAILSQSMRIGPARSGKAGGMKLSTVNKNENIKEQQEAVDVISMWRDRAAFFNSIIQAAGKRPLQVISENTRVVTVTVAQGALKASHACALCGLKRDERLPKIDENVEDSFGEWWTDHWGHTDCRQFWEDNISFLSQR